MNNEKSTSELVFIGTNTEKESQGIYRAWFDQNIGRMSRPQLAAETESPGFLALHPNLPILYATDRDGSSEDGIFGIVKAFIIGPQGELSLLNQQKIERSGYCHISTHPEGSALAAASYFDGHLACFPLAEDGRLLPVAAVVEHDYCTGLGDLDQNRARMHSANFSPDGRFLFACDLGADRIYGYRFARESRQLTPNDVPFTTVPTPSGPRHMTTHPNSRFMYVIDELSSTIDAFTYNKETGSLAPIQRISTLPDDYADWNHTSEIEISDDGRFLFGANRGHNSIANYLIDSETGLLTLRGCTSTQGDHPRDFALSPNDRFMIVSNRNTDNIVIFAIDKETGDLSPAGQQLDLSMPRCIQFVPAM